MNTKLKQQKRIRRHKRIRAKVIGTNKRPRLCVFKSTKYIYAQLIDDEKGHILAAESSLKIRQPANRKAGTEKAIKTNKVAIAYEIGKIIAEKALKKKIKEVVFDRGGYKYHGKVKSLADGAREGGLKL